MATGPTFGSIAALFGYTHDFITRTQYTELVTVVEEEEALGAEEVSIVRHVTVVLTGGPLHREQTIPASLLADQRDRGRCPDSGAVR